MKPPELIKAHPFDALFHDFLAIVRVAITDGEASSIANGFSVRMFVMNDEHVHPEQLKCDSISGNSPLESTPYAPRAGSLQR